MWRIRSFLWRMCHFLYFFSYSFNKNKENCIFLIHISCFGDFLLRKVQKNGFWNTILWLNLWLKLWLNSGFVLKLRHRLGRVTHLCERLSDALASWSGWKFGSKIPVYPILGFGHQPPPQPKIEIWADLGTLRLFTFDLPRIPPLPRKFKFRQILAH